MYVKIEYGTYYIQNDQNKWYYTLYHSSLYVRYIIHVCMTLNQNSFVSQNGAFIHFNNCDL